VDLDLPDADCLLIVLIYGAAIGIHEYSSLVQAPTVWLLGERLFARAAFGAPPLGCLIEIMPGSVHPSDLVDGQVHLEPPAHPWDTPDTPTENAMGVQ